MTTTRLWSSTIAVLTIRCNYNNSIKSNISFPSPSGRIITIRGQFGWGCMTNNSCNNAYPEIEYYDPLSLIKLIIIQLYAATDWAAQQWTFYASSEDKMVKVICVHIIFIFFYLFIYQKRTIHTNTKDIILYVCTFVYLVVKGRNILHLNKVDHTSNIEEKVLRQLMLRAELSCE